MRRRSMFFMCLAMAFPLIAGEAWYFLPNYGQDVRGVETPRRGEGRFFETVPEPARRLLQPDGGLSFDRREKVAWRKAWFPHSGFARMMPEKNVFGWYGHEFGIPAGLAGLDLWLDLGIVDDADETFVNGVMVGKTGVVPGGSVWQEDRLYRVPSAGLNVYGDNFIAVHVWSSRMYLMYKPSGTEVISPSWVPIKKIQWSCHGAANFVTNEWLLSMNSRGSVENIIDAVIHPNWEKIVMNH